MDLKDLAKYKWERRDESDWKERWYNVELCLLSEEENDLEVNTKSYYDAKQSLKLHLNSIDKSTPISTQYLAKTVVQSKQNTKKVEKVIKEAEKLKVLNLLALGKIKEAFIDLWHNFNSDLGRYLDSKIEKRLKSKLTKAQIEEVRDFYLKNKNLLAYQQEEVNLAKVATIYKKKYKDSKPGFKNLDKSIKKLLEDHLEKFGWSYRQNLDSDFVSLKDIYYKFEQHLSGNREVKIRNLNPKIRQLLSKEDQKFFKLVNRHLYLDNYTADLYYKLEFLLLKLLTNNFKVSSKDLSWYSFTDLENLVKNKVLLEKTELEIRKKYRVMALINNKINFYYGNESFKFVTSIVPPDEKIIPIDQFAGSVACPGVAEGLVRIIDNPSKVNKFQEREILVSSMTRADLMVAIKKAGGIVTDLGGVTSHAAIISRELNIPCIVGTKVATKVLKDGMRVEVDANKGVVKILNDQH